MKKNANVITIAYFVFFAMIMLSGMTAGLLSDAVYYLAYVIPLLAVFIVLKDDGFKKEHFCLTRRGARLFLPVIFPTVITVILISYLTSLVLSLVFSGEHSVNIGSDPIYALVYHACIPAVFEELLFRYLPLRFLAPYSKKYAVIFSAVAFALVHHSFFSIPYAFVAGAIFMTLDIICLSALPSVLLHFVNNAVSIIMTMYFSSSAGGAAFFAVLLIFGFLSVLFVIRQRKEYAKEISAILSDKSDPYFSYPMICTSVTAVIVAVYELLT